MAFQEALDGLLRFVMALAATFLVVSAFAPALQKFVGLPSDCVASYDVYLRTTFLRFYFVACMTCAYAVGTCVKLQFGFADGIQAMGARAQRVARCLAVVAVVFTSSGMAVAIATYISFIEATTVQTSCFPAPHACLMDTSYLVIVSTCIILPVICFTHLALYAE